MNGMYPLFVAPQGIETRWATAENVFGVKGEGGTVNRGRKGLPAIRDVAPGSQHTLAEVTGVSGIVRRIWITINSRNAKMLRGLRLDFYWDGASRPAASVPIGDFFGHVLGCMATFQSALLSSPEGRSFNCYIPMPFRKGMKITLTNETADNLEMLFFEVDYTIGDSLGDDALYFHAYWSRQQHTTMQQDYELLPKVQGRGRLLATTIGVIANMRSYGHSWWGEGEVKVYLDGDHELPTLCGTGTEDYIGTGWCQGRFDNLYQGCQLADDAKFWYGLYRQHIPDPIYFARDIRMTIQQIGCWDPNSKAYLYHAQTPIYATGAGRVRLDLSQANNKQSYGLFERENDDWSSCAYFYLDRPENDLPGLAPVSERTEGL